MNGVCCLKGGCNSHYCEESMGIVMVTVMNETRLNVLKDEGDCDNAYSGEILERKSDTPLADLYCD